MNIGLNIYNLVVSIIGTLPIEYNFVYAICTIMLFSFVIMFVAVPFSIIYNLAVGR